MTRQEALAVLTILKTAYPTFYKNYSKEDVNAAVDLWATMFSDEPVSIITEAVKSLICTLKYPPTIADVKEKIAMIMQSQTQTMTEMEAWQRVKVAISYYNASENFAELPPILQKIVGSPNVLKEWSQMDIETLNTVVQSNFMRSYKAKASQEREYEKLPQSTKQLIAGLAQKYSLTEGKYELYSKCSTDADKM